MNWIDLVQYSCCKNQNSSSVTNNKKNSRAFQYLGQLLEIRDCPRDCGTVGAYQYASSIQTCATIASFKYDLNSLTLICFCFFLMLQLLYNLKFLRLKIFTDLAGWSTAAKTSPSKFYRTSLLYTKQVEDNHADE